MTGGSDGKWAVKWNDLNGRSNGKILMGGQIKDMNVKLEISVAKLER
jgi:hypothetical protein